MRSSQENLRELVDRLPEGVCVMQGERLVYVNTAYARSLRVSEHELLGRSRWNSTSSSHCTCPS